MVLIIEVNYPTTPFISFKTSGIPVIFFPNGYITNYPANIPEVSFYTVLDSPIIPKYFLILDTLFIWF